MPAACAAARAPAIWTAYLSVSGDFTRQGQILEGPAGDQLHGDVLDAAGRADVVDGDDVGMVEGGRGLGFLNETPAGFRVARAAAE